MTNVDTKALTVDQEVAIASPRSWGPHSLSTGWKVTKVTPSGQVTVSRQLPDQKEPIVKRFDNRGEEMGFSGGRYSRPFLRVDVDQVRLEIRARKQRVEVVVAFQNVRKLVERDVGDMWQVQDYQRLVAQLQEAVEACRSKVEAIGAVPSPEEAKVASEE